MNHLHRLLNYLVLTYRRNSWRFNLRKHLVDLDRVPIDRPVFLLGTQGGGLTLVSRMLRRHNEVVSVTGDSSYWNGPDEMQNVLSPELPEPLRLEGRAELEPYGGRSGWIYASDELVDVFRKEADEATRFEARRLKTLLREIVLLHGGREGARFTDKSQSYTLKVRYLDRLLEGTSPHFVLLTRNPYAVCLRAIDKTHLATLDRPTEDKLHMASQHWSNSIGSALEAAGGSSRFVSKRFEDILREPERHVRDICEFVGLKFEANMLPGPNDEFPLGGLRDDKWYPLRPDVNGKYLRDLSSEERAVIDEYCRSLAERFGYSPDGP